MSAREEKPSEPGFDEKLSRLEAIVTELEEGGLALEPAIDRYQEGIDLLRQCHGVLRGFQQQVEELTRDAEDALRPFEADPDALDVGEGAETP
jgi:exodeoxyribonuclease VII small subunit